MAIGSTPDDFLDLTSPLEAELGQAPVEEPAVDPTEIGRAAIEQALLDHGGSVSAAARALGLRNRYVLHRLMKKHAISAPGEEDDE